MYIGPAFLDKKHHSKAPCAQARGLLLYATLPTSSPFPMDTLEPETTESQEEQKPVDSKFIEQSLILAQAEAAVHLGRLLREMRQSR